VDLEAVLECRDSVCRVKKSNEKDFAFCIISLLKVNHSISKLMSKYSLDNSLLNVSYTVLKEQMWKHFVGASVVDGTLSVF